MMAEVFVLCSALGVHFSDWNLARLKCLAQIILSMMLVKTVNLSQISSGFRGSAKQASNYKRIQRFMRTFSVPLGAVAKFIVRLFPFPDFWYISIDRTNWKFGKKSINVFVLAICYGGIAVPLLWKTLDKCANTTTQQRIDILDRFIKLFGINKICNLLGDREFIGIKWLAFLVESKISFTIRVKFNHMIPNSRGILKPAKNFFRNIRIGEMKCLGKKKIMGSMLYIVGVRINKEDLCILVTDAKPEDAIQRYAFRQEIETMFGCLKTRGFNFEATHITKPERLDNLMAVIAISFAWSYRAGDIFKDVEPIKIKSHGRKAVSVFKHGYDYLRRLIININSRSHELFENLLFISAPKSSVNSLKNIMRA